MLHRLDETANAGAATGVSATAGNAAATVSWSPPVSNGGSAITQYSVLSSPGGFSAVVSGSVLTVTVSGLTNGISYTFTVTAQNFLGFGPASAPSNAVTPTAPTPPGAPTNVSATPGNGSASVSWTAPSSDGGSAITQYTVTAAPGGITATSTTPSPSCSG